MYETLLTTSGGRDEKQEKKNRYSKPKVKGNGSMLVVRTNNAVTFVQDYPRRHVQVILRLYASPAEILMGFDVDSCAMCFDGSRCEITI